MKGWKTVAFNGAIAVGAAGLTYLAGIDWTEFVSAQTAILITTAANIALRFVTNTPVGKAG